MRDVLRVVLAALSVFSMGGVVFGLAALYPVLYAEGVFVGLCGEAAEACLSHPAPLKCCDAQMLRNTLVSCVALFASDGMMVVFGEVADRARARRHRERRCAGTGGEGRREKRTSFTTFRTVGPARRS